MKTAQLGFWTGAFGKEYTERRAFTNEQLQEFHLKTWGITCRDLFKEFFGDNKIDNILEVGCSIGNKLNCLQAMGYYELYGIEVQKDAVERSKAHTKGINIIHGSGFDIPYKDGFFDLVFTCGVLIHINPKNIATVMQEISRVSKCYIFGFEYFAEEYTEILYRGHQNALWKTDFAKLYIDTVPGLKLLKEKKYPYLTEDNIDQAYLIEKQS
jgi:pseudaminic acid biosynthesis-associated methylase|tara:strand:+ start:529 stop:1164 length:636 start_codon:yes stop_codon:yes gene_type:complete